jgi:DNA polymerase
MITLDFETRGVPDLPKVGQRRYATDTSTQALCLAWAYDQEEEVHLWHRGHQEPDADEPWCYADEPDDELIRRIADGEPVEAHNAGFEFHIWNEALLRDFPAFKVKLQIEQMHCSAAKASCLSLPRALEDAIRAVGLPEHKIADGKRLINKLSKPMIRRGKNKGDGVIIFCEEEVEHRRNWEYCKQDVRAERGLSNFCPEMIPREREYWLMDFRMNNHGVMLDKKAAHEALGLAKLEAERLNTELEGITSGQVLKGSQRAALLKWANGRLVELDQEPLANTKADTLSFALDGVPTKAGDEAREAAAEPSKERWDSLGEEGARVSRALRICMEVNRSSVAKYRSMEQSVCSDDGKLHDLMLFNGADRTARWSGKGVQPHNFVRGYGPAYDNEMTDAWKDILTLDRELITLIWGEPMVCLAKACRGALIASPGKELYAADFNAIEARKLAWLSGCSDMLAMFVPGKDIYCDMASGIYGRLITKADKVERQLGKKAILGLGYSMGWEKFQATVYMEEGIWLEDEFCQMVVRVYRKEKYPEVPTLWRSSEKAAIAAVVEGGEHYCGGDDLTGDGRVSYFMSDDGNFLHCRLPSGRLLAYLYPRVNMRVTYRFAALNARGRPTMVNFPAKKSVPQHRVRWHAEKLAEKQLKTLLPDPPESFVSPHLSFMGRNIITKQWQRCGTHGGSLVENYDQASSRDLLAEAMFRVDQMDEFALLLSIHDEVIAEAAKGTCTVKEFEAIMSVVPGWAPGMPITAEGWVGQRLRK